MLTHNGSRLFAVALVVLGLNASSEVALAQNESIRKQSAWRGRITGEPIVLASPLSPLPTVREGARRVLLPAPKDPVPEAAIIPFDEGGGNVSLLAPWHGGWLVGTSAGEWSGALYVAMPGHRVGIARGNVIGGFTWRGHLYVLSGLQHLFLDTGELWEVDLEASKLVRRMPLHSMPTEVIATANDRLIVRTGKGDVALLSSGGVVCWSLLTDSRIELRFDACGSTEVGKVKIAMIGEDLAHEWPPPTAYQWFATREVSLNRPAST